MSKTSEVAEIPAAPAELADVKPLTEGQGMIFQLLEVATDGGDLSKIMEVCDFIAKSDFVPASFGGKGGNVMMALELGQSVGLPAALSLSNIAVINGRPTLWGDAILAIVLANGGTLVETPIIDNNSGKVTGYQCTASRPGKPDLTRQFTMEDAKIAQLAGKKGPWQQYPARMMQMRARSFACRDQYADWLSGLDISDGMTVIDGDTGEILSTESASRSEDVLSRFSTDDATDAQTSDVPDDNQQSAPRRQSGTSEPDTDDDASTPMVPADRMVDLFGLAASQEDAQTAWDNFVDIQDQYTNAERVKINKAYTDAKQRLGSK